MYKLLSDERCLSVMAVMRIDSVEVTQLGQARSNRFELLQAEQRRCGELITVNKFEGVFLRRGNEHMKRRSNKLAHVHISSTPPLPVIRNFLFLIAVFNALLFSRA